MPPPPRPRSPREAPRDVRARGQRRLAALAALLVVVIAFVVIVTSSGGSGGGGTGSQGRRSAGAHRVRKASTRHGASRAGTPALSYRSLGVLPAAVQDAAAAPLTDNRSVLLGGLTAADTSTASATIITADGHTGSGPPLPEAQHDAQAATLAGSVYVFGGGSLAQYSHILRYDPAAGTVSEAGQLPQAQSDVAVAAIGATAYIVGGYNGTQFLDTILAWRPGGPARVVGHLPAGVRYAAVAASGGQLIIAGGSLTTGASDAIYSFDPATGTVKAIGRLPQALTHASAATLAGSATVYVVGGRGDATGSATAAIEAIDPASGRAQAAGHLPAPLSDAAVISTAGGILVAGGHSDTATQAPIGELVAH